MSKNSKAKKETSPKVENDVERESDGFLEPEENQEPEEAVADDPKLLEINPEFKGELKTLKDEPAATNKELAARAHKARYDLKIAERENNEKKVEAARAELSDLVNLHQKVIKNPCGEDVEWTSAHKRVLQNLLK